jgi:hypothetical protein
MLKLRTERNKYTGGKMSTDVTRDTPAARSDEQPQQQGAPEIRWDDTRMKSSYANVCNVTSTREAVVFLFGVNQAWNPAQREIPVQLTDRITVSPLAARRVAILLQNALREYESRFGQLPDPRAGV